MVGRKVVERTKQKVQSNNKEAEAQTQTGGLKKGKEKLLYYDKSSHLT